MGRLKSAGTGCLIVIVFATGGFIGCWQTLECVPLAGNLPRPPIDPRRSWPDNIPPKLPPWPILDLPAGPPATPVERWLERGLEPRSRVSPPSRLRGEERERKLQAMARIFVSQEQLDSWVMEESARLADKTLHWDGRVFRIEAAVRFLKTVGDEADPHQLLGRVKTLPQLTQLAAEHYMDSVLLGDTGYEVQQGFIGSPEG
jgi:hypothetical protein